MLDIGATDVHPSTRIRFRGNVSRKRKPRQKPSSTARAAALQPPIRRDRMARVQVTDDVWTDFRALAGYRPMSELLGELVMREVEKYRSQKLRAGQLEPRELLDALEQAQAQRADLEAIVRRLEALRDAR